MEDAPIFFSNLTEQVIYNNKETSQFGQFKIVQLGDVSKNN